MDRRKFLQSSGTSLAGFLINPTAGVVGAFAAGFVSANPNANPGKEQQQLELSQLKSKVLIRAREAVDTAGRPFGEEISEFLLLDGRDVLEKDRTIAVVAHDKIRQSDNLNLVRSSIGLATIEFEKTERGWQHAVAGPLNRTWNATTPVPMEGARLIPEKPASWHQVLTCGVGPVEKLTTTPWQTVLAVESGATETLDSLQIAPEQRNDFGWVIELNPFTGSAIKRFSLGRVEPKAILPVARPGQPLAVYLLGRGQLFKFISHQRINKNQQNANVTTLVIGELYVANFAQSKWISLTQDLNPEAWRERMLHPYHAPMLPEPRELGAELRLLEQNKIAVGTKLVLIEAGEASDVESFLTEEVSLEESARQSYRFGNALFYFDRDEIGCFLGVRE